MYNLEEAMKHTLLVCLVMVATACKQKSQPIPANNPKDSTIFVMDTVTGGSLNKEYIEDSLLQVHKRDSFYAIKPITTFISDAKGDAYKKLIATIIDTNGVTRIPLKFTDTTISKFDRNNGPFCIRDIYKNNRFVVEVLSPDEEHGPRRLFINGHELRAGIEIDTSISGSAYTDDIDFSLEEFALLKFGEKEYLFLAGNIYHCNGMGCGVVYYILYDPATRKAMLLKQFRTEFITGYDKATHSPVFIDVGDEGWRFVNLYKGFIYSGKAYRLDHTMKIKRALNNAGKQYHFTAYSRNGGDTIVLIKGITRSVY